MQHQIRTLQTKQRFIWTFIYDCTVSKTSQKSRLSSGRSVWSFKSLMAFFQLPSNEWWVQIKSKKDWMDHSALLRRRCCSTLIKLQPFLCYLNCYDNSLGTKTTWTSKDHLIEDYTKRFTFNGLLWTENTAKKYKTHLIHNRYLTQIHFKKNS
jgi:hypothetical protein